MHVPAFPTERVWIKPYSFCTTSILSSVVHMCRGRGNIHTQTKTIYRRWNSYLVIYKIMFSTSYRNYQRQKMGVALHADRLPPSYTHRKQHSRVLVTAILPVCWDSLLCLLRTSTSLVNAHTTCAQCIPVQN